MRFSQACDQSYGGWCTKKSYLHKLIFMCHRSRRSTCKTIDIFHSLVNRDNRLLCNPPTQINIKNDKTKDR